MEHSVLLQSTIEIEGVGTGGFVAVSGGHGDEFTGFDTRKYLARWAAPRSGKLILIARPSVWRSNVPGAHLLAHPHRLSPASADFRVESEFRQHRGLEPLRGHESHFDE